MGIEPERMELLTPEKRTRIRELLQQKGLATTRPAMIPRRGDTEPCAMSMGQQRLWFLNRLDPGNPVYNISRALRIRGPLNTTALRSAFREIIDRHEALRTVFLDRDGDAQQQVTPTPESPLEEIETLENLQR